MRGNRRAFTLIEMLVVVSILMIITVAVVAVAPRFTDDRKLSRAADGISQWLLTAKQRALRDQVPTGVRLFPDPQHNNLVTELQYIQQPDDFKGGAITIGPAMVPGVPLPVLAATGFGVDFMGGFGPGSPNPNFNPLWPVQPALAGYPGDYLEVKGTGLVHLITGVTTTTVGTQTYSALVLATPFGFGTVTPGAGTPPITSTITLTNSTGTLPGNANQLAVGMFVNSPNWPGNLNDMKITAINNTTVPPTITVQSSFSPAGSLAVMSFIPPPSTWIPGMTGVASPPPLPPPGSTPEYRVIRQPRVLTGETPLQLPAGICIDPSRSVGLPSTPPGDIMFSSQGGVLNSNGNDRFILWVNDYTKDASSPGEQFLILIQTHTGFIAQHPVAPGTNPYLYTQDARSSGL